MNLGFDPHLSGEKIRYSLTNELIFGPSPHRWGSSAVSGRTAVRSRGGYPQMNLYSLTSSLTLFSELAILANMFATETKKKISMIFVAKFMLSSFAQQRSMVVAEKKEEGEGHKAVLLYYCEARSGIARYISRGGDKQVLTSSLSHLRDREARSCGVRRSRLAQNIRALEAFQRNFVDLDYEVLPRISANWSTSDICVPTTPEICFRNGRKEFFARLLLSQREAEPEMRRILQHLLLLGVESVVPDIEPSNIALLHLESGKLFRLPRRSNRLLRNIAAACETISGIWDTT